MDTAGCYLPLVCGYFCIYHSLQEKEYQQQGKRALECYKKHYLACNYERPVGQAVFYKADWINTSVSGGVAKTM